MRRAGFTLFELMVAGTLLSLLLTVSLSLLKTTFQSSSRAAVRVELQQRACLSMENLLADLERCSASSVHLFTAQPVGQPYGLCLQRLEGFSSGGVQLWEPTLICYHWNAAQRRLARVNWLPAKPALSILPTTAQPVAPTPADFLMLARNSGPGYKLLAEAVKQVGLVQEPGRLRISLWLERQLSDAGRESFEMHRVFSFRNSW
ncbi:MAG: prepilin-type N-terminal cleavage/methylation domain-containing protein [Vulcanimicrobiota bacterium]